ncbi:MAG: hypothetical protein JWM91_3941 [Rhodospirillales bacterium]|nr:hypothetical protein [Rhodospirillales bacterium]
MNEPSVILPNISRQPADLLLADEPPVDVPVAGESALTLATYNIHSCFGLDRRFDPDRVAEVICELGADVIALQEVDAQHGVRGYVDQWAFLADTTGYVCIPGISLRTHRKVFGNALLTRLPVVRTRLHDISVDRCEPRGVIDVDLAVAGGMLRILATHLGLRAAERRRQSERIAKIAGAGGEALGTVLLGDMNDWRPRSPSIRCITRLFHRAHSALSFPSRLPMFPLDRVLGMGNIQLGDIAAHRSRLARIASDHLPITAKLSWVSPT